jgi:RNA polymerase sigma-70 factor, ECF subfamily
MPLSAHRETVSSEEIAVVAAIRGGDEHAFATAVDRHHRAMVAVANAYVLTPDAASQVVHEAWLAALADAERFDGKVPLRAWLLRFVVRVAAPLAARFDGESSDPAKPAVDPDRFRAGADAFPGHWRAYPRDWRALPDDVRRGAGARRVVEAAVAALPVEQRAVITVRDIVGCPAPEACAILDVSDTVARERLHQARCRVRAALERHFDD